MLTVVLLLTTPLKTLLTMQVRISGPRVPRALIILLILLGALGPTSALPPNVVTVQVLWSPPNTRTPFVHRLLYRLVYPAGVLLITAAPQTTLAA